MPPACRCGDQHKDGAKNPQHQSDTPSSLKITCISCPVSYVLKSCLLLACRIGSPVLLRQLLQWLTRAASPEGAPAFEGWMWAGLLASSGFLLTMIHHQFLWCVHRSLPQQHASCSCSP